MKLIQTSEDLSKDGIYLPLGYAIFTNVEVNKNYPNELDEYISSVKESLLENFTLKNIRNNDIISAYRKFYWHYLNIDPTKTRPSNEALIRRVLAEKHIPRISNIVNAYNWVSIDSFLPLGAYDFDVLDFPLHLRYAQKGEKFTPIGGKSQKFEGKEIILVDHSGRVLFQYPYRDADFSKITLSTSKILLIACGVNGISKEKIKKTLKKTKNIFQKKISSKIKFEKYEIL